MADTQPSFEHTRLETQLHELAREVKEQRQSPELKDATDRQLVSEAVKKMADAMPTPAPTGPAPTPGVLPSYTQSASAQTKLEIEYLLDMAFHDGLEKAVREAKKSNPFVMDAFRDALAGRLHDELKNRGLLS